MRVDLGDYYKAVGNRLTNLMSINNLSNIDVVADYNPDSSEDDIYILYKLTGVSPNVFPGFIPLFGIDQPSIELSVFRANLPETATVPSIYTVWSIVSNFFNGYTGFIDPSGAGVWSSKCVCYMDYVDVSDADSFTAIHGSISLEV